MVKAIHNGVEAGFNFTEPVIRNLATNFTNTSQNGRWYTWNFDDGSASDLANPSHTFTQAGTYDVELTAGNLCSSDSITHPVKVEDYAVVLASDLPEQSGNLGQSLYYTFTLTNTGTLTDSFQLKLGNSAWNAMLSTYLLGPLGPGKTGTFTVRVTIPTGLVSPAQRDFTVKATSTNDPRIPKAAGTAAFRAIFTPLYAMTISPEQLVLTGTLTTEFTYMLAITNTGNMVDSYDLSVTNSDWVIVTPDTVNNLLAGQQVGVEVHVVIPSNANLGSTEQVVITVQSVHDAALSRQLTLWIHVEDLLKLFLPVVAK